jgi:hypothetical protein
MRPDVVPLTNSSGVFGRRKKTQSVGTDDAEAQLRGNVVKETDQEVSALIVAMDDQLGEAAAPKPMHMRQIGAKPLQRENETIANRQWLRICWPMIGAACRHHLDARGSVIVIGTAKGTETEIVTMSGLVLAAITMVTMNVNVETGTRSESVSIDAVLTEAHMMSYLTVMALRPHDDDVMMKMIILVEIPEIPRYDMCYHLSK